MKWSPVRFQRRTFLGLVAGGVAPVKLAQPAAAATGDDTAAAAATVVRHHEFQVLNQVQSAFISAAIDVLIPADDLSPSATECGVAEFIDRQLAGRWGAGGGSYRQGPFLKGSPEFGEQLALTPLEFFREAIRSINAWSQTQYGAEFDQLSVPDRERVMRALEQGEPVTAFPDAKVFFEQLRRLTFEGFLADPIYGGNQGKAAWRMIGYPGLPSLYAQHAKSPQEAPLRLPPKSIGDFS